MAQSEMCGWIEGPIAEHDPTCARDARWRGALSHQAHGAR